MNQAILNPIRFSETGGRPDPGLADVQVLTGTNPDGTTARNCLDWTSTSDTLALDGGVVQAGPYAWIAGATTSCSVTYGHILCMGHTRNVAVTPTATPGRKVWTTNIALSIMPGQSFDTICQASRPAGVQSAAALQAHPGLAASSVIDPAQTYLRLDNAVVGTGAELAAGGELRSGIWQSGNGVYGVTAGAWTGQTSPSLPGTLAGTCGDWVDPTLAAPAIMGNISRTTSYWWNSGTFPTACMTSGTVYCIQTAP
jgi:hypothetical protein